MESIIQVLTIIVDVLIIVFFLLLIILIARLVSAAKKISKFAGNMSDIHFWISLLTKAPRHFCKKKDKC
ncbi:MAG: hypothetical protein PHV30_10100 [Candidatus Margulisbacteria bacterium]|nr:hypothetical protein [Candidatus Margulisiibacteriota bacterium]